MPLARVRLHSKIKLLQRSKDVLLSSPKIAAVVVLYQPTCQLMDNISSYLHVVEELFLVDNTELPAPELVDQLTALPAVSYLPNGENLGVARALNIGAERALAAGYDLLLTMDQDSCATPDMLTRMLECLADLDPEKVGMLSPFHVTRSGHLPGQEKCQDVMTPMTSGCLLNLQAYREVGPFLDELFIDFVDNEYCLRLRKQGFEVLRANLARLEHSVGDTRKYGPFIATNHSPLRRYYKTRNRFLVFARYFGDFPGHCLFDLVRLVKEIGSIILFESEKLAKLRMMWLGWCDFLRGRYGRYDG
jgi:rhamnosyltransferase